MRAAEDRGERLHGDTHDVVERLLRLQRHAAGLGVEPETGGRVVGVESLAHQPGVEASRRAELGDLLEEIIMRREKEGETRSECSERNAGVNSPANVFQRIGKRERDFLYCGRTGLPHVIAGDRDRIEVHLFFRDETEDVGNQSQ